MSDSNNDKDDNDDTIAADIKVSLEHQLRDVNTFFSNHPQMESIRFAESSPVHLLITCGEDGQCYCVLHPNIKGNLLYIERHISMTSIEEHRQYLETLINNSMRSAKTENISEEEIEKASRRQGHILEPLHFTANVIPNEFDKDTTIEYGKGRKPIEIPKDVKFYKEEGKGRTKIYQLPKEFGLEFLIPDPEWTLSIVEDDTRGQGAILRPDLENEDIFLAIGVRAAEVPSDANLTVFNLFRELIKELKVEYKERFSIGKASNFKMADSKISGARVIVETFRDKLPDRKILFMAGVGRHNNKIYYMRYDSPFNRFLDWLQEVERTLNTIAVIDSERKDN